MSVVHETPSPAFWQPPLAISWEASCKSPWPMKATLGQKAACSEAFVPVPDTNHLSAQAVQKQLEQTGCI